MLHMNVLADCLTSTSRLFRCGAESLRWEHRRALLGQQLLRYDCDILGLCEVDRYEDFSEMLTDKFAGAFRQKRKPARDGSAVFWRRSRLVEGLGRAVFLESVKRQRAAQVALMQRVCLQGAEARNIVICSTHLRARAEDRELRLQQASEVVTAVTEFSRGDPHIILADLNDDAAHSDSCGPPENAFEYFLACGYRCAYRSVANGPAYTTWAGWATGDYRAVCDHIFVSSGVHVASVLDVPDPERLAHSFVERLPNKDFPSDHVSLVADLVIP